MDRTLDDLLQKSIGELKRTLLDEQESIPAGLIDALENDTRRAARDLARRLRSRTASNRAEGQRLRHLLRFERELWDEGFVHVAGVDEAGMAPLAGPVVAGAVILPRNYRLRGLDDSKKILHELRREELAVRIKADAICWSVGWAEVEEIDRLNIYQAGLLAMRRAVEALPQAPEFILPDFVLVDARRIPDCAIPQRGIIRGDQLSASIAAASIIAKTTRDQHLHELDAQYPGYGLASHKGYPTPEHLEALKRLGVLPIHRRSFGPVRQALGLESAQLGLFD